MIIAIDGNEANVENRLGVGEYAFELLEQFKRLKIKDLGFRIYLKNSPLPHMPEVSEQWQYRIVKPGRAWTQIGLPMDLFIHRPKPDVFFTPTHYSPRFATVPTAMSIMDLSYLYFPELFRKQDLYKLKNWSLYSARHAKRIFTISNASKNDIIKEYGVPEDRVVVTYPGIKNKMVSSQKQSLEMLQKKYDIGKDFILFVGTLQPRKNIVRLVEAYAKIKKNDLQLVIIGKKGWQYEDILSSPEKFGVKEHVKFLDFVPDEDLGSFYQHALFFVLPSLYEGFGLPVLEAMSHDCPVITSNVSSLPEVGGDAVLYVNPEDTDDIKDKMEKLLEDKKLRAELIEKGKKQVKKFSWEKTAKETLAILEEVADKTI